MGYSFYIISREKPIAQNDFFEAFNSLSKFNREGHIGKPVCDVDFDNPNYIRVSGSYGISGMYAEGFVLNIVMCLLDLGYKPKVISRDWDYGTKEDFEWLEAQK